MSKPNFSPSNRHLLIGIFAMLVIIVLSGTFFVGMHVGEYRASQLATKRFRQAGFPAHLVKEMRAGRHVFGPERHGHGGDVTAVNDGSLTIARRDGSERTVLVTPETVVRSRSDEVQNLTDITVGMHVVAIGHPNKDGDIAATMLILPPWQKRGE